MAASASQCSALQLFDVFSIKKGFTNANGGNPNAFDDAVNILENLPVFCRTYEEEVCPTSTIITFPCMELGETLRVLEAVSVLQTALELAQLDASNVVQLAHTTVRFSNQHEMRVTGYTCWHGQAAECRRVYVNLKASMRDMQNLGGAKNDACEKMKTSLSNMKHLHKGKSVFPTIDTRVVTLDGGLALAVTMHVGRMVSAAVCKTSLFGRVLPHIDCNGNIVVDPSVSSVAVQKKTTGCVSLQSCYYWCMGRAIEHMLGNGKSLIMCHILNGMHKSTVCLHLKFHTPEQLFVHTEATQRSGKRKRKDVRTQMMFRSANPVQGAAEWMLAETEICPYSCTVVA